jgi:hypothetical protein
VIIRLEKAIHSINVNDDAEDNRLVLELSRKITVEVMAIEIQVPRTAKLEKKNKSILSIERDPEMTSMTMIINLRKDSPEVVNQ